MAAVFHLKPSSKIPSSIRNALRHSSLRFKSTESKTSRKTSRLDGLRRKLKEENDGSVPLVTFTMPESDTESDTDSVQCDEESYSFHLKTYGCQMNVSDSSIVRSVLLSSTSPKFHEVEDSSNADISLTNTCAIRENAETKVWNRMYSLRASEKNKPSTSPKQIIALLGCMSERLKTSVFSDSKASIDVVCGPDAYASLPSLLSSALTKQERGCNTELSFTETYDDVVPVRSAESLTESYISIMRGCNNMCSYCIVPFTRGRERSKGVEHILDDFRRLVDSGVKEVTLLGQNVNSYHDKTTGSNFYEPSNPGFKNMYKRSGSGMYFTDLMDSVSRIDSSVRIRFTSPHPKDFPERLLDLISERVNLCNSIHLPAQSGSATVLERMRRGYDAESYLKVVDAARSKIEGVAISSDFITGFCGETEEEHCETLQLMERVRYDQAFMFKYSMRGKTHAHRRMEDDVEEKVKGRRLEEVIEVFRRNVQAKNEEEEMGQERVVLVEGTAKRSTAENRTLTGRTDGNKRVVFGDGCGAKAGGYVKVRINEVRGHTLRGEEIGRCDIKGNLENVG
ncbi:hypothetical protein TrST_g2592 [Triparma strigata]|uniref:CDK5RAP1-like protein n=2 Tax=Triparma strigata TaxID=1606541 RepID=A0A9W7EXD3_9STRA|nr:hypothetical protein TrST_g2592 [Triparma strigata]